MKQYLVSSIILFVIVAVASVISRHMGWYSDYWFTDIILHTISGVALGLAWMGITKQESVILKVAGAMSFASFGSVLWEFWEFAGWRIMPTHTQFYIPELADTLGDICCGMIGGFVVSLIVVLFTNRRRES